jgi:hypothetical protein
LRLVVVVLWLLVVMVVERLSRLWLRMGWHCWGESWRRADTGTTDPTGTTTTVSIRVGAVRYGTVFTGQNETEVPSRGVRSLPSRCSWMPLLATLESAGSWWLKTDRRIDYERGDRDSHLEASSGLISSRSFPLPCSLRDARCVVMVRPGISILMLRVV